MPEADIVPAPAMHFTYFLVKALTTDRTGSGMDCPPKVYRLTCIGAEHLEAKLVRSLSNAMVNCLVPHHALAMGSNVQNPMIKCVTNSGQMLWS